MRYCGKRGAASLREMVRPKTNDDPTSARKYKCPDNYKPCNDNFFDEELDAGHDFVVCIPEGASIEENCPITDVTFERPADMTGYKELQSANGEKKLYVSRNRMQHGIESLRVSPNQPCFDPAE